jgi:hypothetical protein
MSGRSLTALTLQRGAALFAGAFGFATGFMSVELLWRLI